jgi:hypothetical protein
MPPAQHFLIYFSVLALLHVGQFSVTENLGNTKTQNAQPSAL